MRCVASLQLGSGNPVLYLPTFCPECRSCGDEVAHLIVKRGEGLVRMAGLVDVLKPNAKTKLVCPDDRIVGDRSVFLIVCVGDGSSNQVPERTAEDNVGEPVIAAANPLDANGGRYAVGRHLNPPPIVIVGDDRGDSKCAGSMAGRHRFGGVGATELRGIDVPRASVCVRAGSTGKPFEEAGGDFGKGKRLNQVEGRPGELLLLQCDARHRECADGSENEAIRADAVVQASGGRCRCGEGGEVCVGIGGNASGRGPIESGHHAHDETGGTDQLERLVSIERERCPDHGKDVGPHILPGGDPPIRVGLECWFATFRQDRGGAKDPSLPRCERRARRWAEGGSAEPRAWARVGYGLHFRERRRPQLRARGGGQKSMTSEECEDRTQDAGAGVQAFALKRTRQNAGNAGWKREHRRAGRVGYVTTLRFRNIQTKCRRCPLFLHKKPAGSGCCSMRVRAPDPRRALDLRSVGQARPVERAGRERVKSNPSVVYFPGLPGAALPS